MSSNDKPPVIFNHDDTKDWVEDDDLDYSVISSVISRLATEKCTIETTSNTGDVEEEARIQETIHKIETCKEDIHKKETFLRELTNENLLSLEKELEELQVNRLNLESQIVEKAARQQHLEKKILDTKIKQEQIKGKMHQKDPSDANSYLTSLHGHLDLDRRLKVLAALDICICMDLTGSMEPYINAMIFDSIRFLEDLKLMYPNIPSHFAFVGYRDHCDGKDRLVVNGFTNDLSVIISLLQQQRAMGGGDGPEDVFGALNAVATLKWTSESRFLLHIGDYPCHGLRYHDLPDDYPEGDPFNLKAETLLSNLKQLNVTYLFGKITHNTDKMIRIFNDITHSHHQISPYVKEIDVKNAAVMVRNLCDEVASTMSGTLSRSASVASLVENTKDIQVSNKEPDWDDIKTETIAVYHVVEPIRISEIISSDETFEYLQETVDMVQVKISPEPFAKGSTRLAHYCKIIEDSSSKYPHGSIHVHKLPMNEMDQTKDQIIQETISVYHTAQSFAEVFNMSKKDHIPSIKFIPLTLIQYQDRSSETYSTQEERLVGSYFKYNSNIGYVAPRSKIRLLHIDESHDVVQSFSHWTYETSGEYMMVVDCQGVYDNELNTFRFTDPAIHCKDVLRFGKNNLGVSGFDRFKLTHRCNDYCRDLGLRPYPEPIGTSAGFP